MRYLARLRLVLARRPWLYWLVVGLAAAVAGLTAARSQARVDDARDEWGRTRTVWVAVADAATGELLDAEAREYPVAVVPAGAITERPHGVAAHPVDAGEVLATGDVASADGVAATWVVIAVPVAGSPRITPGAGVLVIGNGRPLCDGIAVDVPTDVAVEIAVPPVCAADLGTHLVAGTVVLARHT